MKKVLKKVLASAAILSMLGAGSSTMGLNPACLPKRDRVGNRITYKMKRDGRITAMVHVGDRVHQIRIENKRDVFEILGYKREDERNFSYMGELPRKDGNCNRLDYVFNGNKVIVTPRRDGVPQTLIKVGKIHDGIAYFNREGIRTIFGI